MQKKNKKKNPFNTISFIHKNKSNAILRQMFYEAQKRNYSTCDEEIKLANPKSLSL